MKPLIHVKLHNHCGFSSGLNHKSSLNALMNDCQLSGAKLAERVNVHPNTVANWRNGKTPIPGAVLAYLELLAKVRSLTQ